jgi:carbonic anhydrase
MIVIKEATLLTPLLDHSCSKDYAWVGCSEKRAEKPEIGNISIET